MIKHPSSMLAVLVSIPSPTATKSAGAGCKHNSRRTETGGWEFKASLSYIEGLGQPVLHKTLPQKWRRKKKKKVEEADKLGRRGREKDYVRKYWWA